jgi:hypothetical protein
VKLRVLAALVLATAALAGCDDGHPGPTARPGSATPSTSPGASPTSSSTTTTVTTPPAPVELGDAEAKQLMRRAQRALVRADTGRYRVSAVAGAESVESEGRYRLSDLSHESRISVGDQEERVQISSVAIRERVWARLDHAPGQEARTCWSTLDAGSLVDAIGYDVPGAVTGVPSAVAVALSTVRPTGASTSDTSTRMRVEADLIGVAASLLGSAPLALGIDPASTASVPINLFVADGQITGWSVDLATVFRSAEAAGADLPENARAFLDQPDLAVIRVNFYDPGSEVDLQPPPREQVVPVPADDPDYARAARDCEGGSQA